MSKLLITVLVCLPALFHSRQATVFRGGSAVQSPPSIRQALSALPNGAQLESRPVVVTVSAGSRYLDRRRLLRVKSTSSIADVRASLREQFPGLPPVKLQRLYLGSKLLADEDVISELTDLSPVPLSLDLLTGTGIYNRTVLSVADALEMLTALEVHSTANSELQRQLRGGVTDIDQSDSPRIERLELLFREQNNSLYKTWAADIQRAQTAERNPEKDAVDTAGWRRSSNKEPPMRWGILNVLDMNAEEARSALVATLLLSAYAKWTASSPSSKYILLFGAWGYWLSRLRPLRYYLKVLFYFFLPQLNQYGFLLPLLSTPYQALSRHFGKSLGFKATASNARRKVKLLVNVDAQYGTGNTIFDSWMSYVLRAIQASPVRA